MDAPAFPVLTLRQASFDKLRTGQGERIEKHDFDRLSTNGDRCCRRVRIEKRFEERIRIGKSIYGLGCVRISVCEA
ncbi:MAG: hypothetical protein LBD67_03465 [Candidatus Accumulibacter sp.]|jgi:hypothetical protein|nr:hypothetical protein [Accumulibacter sp.]